MSKIFGWRVFHVLRAAFRAAVLGDFTTGLLGAQDALDAGSFARLVARLDGDSEWARLSGPRPSLSLKTIDTGRLFALAPDTLGHRWVRFLGDNGILADVALPECPFPTSDEIRWAKRRWRETHDLRHVLTGLTPAIPDEAVLHAFQLGQHFTWFSLVLALVAPLYGAREQSPLVTWGRMPEAWRAGRRARLLLALPLEEHLHEPVAALRRRWGVANLSHLSARPAPPHPARSGAELLRAVRPFAKEQRARTWLLLWSTVLVYGALVATAMAPFGPLRILGTLGMALVAVRLFAFLHDAEHGAIFRGSRAGALAIHFIGVVTCVCPPVWREFHNRHHRSTALVLTGDEPGLRPGDFINRVVDAPAWSGWPASRRLLYRIVRHPLFFAAGWLTAFLLGACVAQAIRDPRRNGVALITVALHLCWLGALGLVGGANGLLFAGLLPAALGGALGTWLVFVQHSFPGVRYQHADRSDFVRAALEGASWFDMPAWLHWCTGNVGFHHVHHFHPGIPFYRLPEAQAAIPEFRCAPRITWHPRDQLACLWVQAWHGTATGPLPPVLASPHVEYDHG